MNVGKHTKRITIFAIVIINVLFDKSKHLSFWCEMYDVGDITGSMQSFSVQADLSEWKENYSDLRWTLAHWNHNSCCCFFSLLFRFYSHLISVCNTLISICLITNLFLLKLSSIARCCLFFLLRYFGGGFFSRSNCFPYQAIL